MDYDSPEGKHRFDMLIHSIEALGSQQKCEFPDCLGNTYKLAGLILGLRQANERCRYKVTPSLIGWVQT